MKITIRQVGPEDASMVATIHAGDEAASNTYQLPYPNIEHWRQRLTVVDGNLIHLMAEADGEGVGMIGLQLNGGNPRRKHAAGIGMVVREGWRGKGVGSALLKAAIALADDYLNIERLELEVYATNSSAIALYQKHGFEVEGTLRKWAYSNGQLVDALVMSRIRSSRA